MIVFFKDLLNRFARISLVKKILCIFSLIIYLFIIVICLVKVNVEMTTPGVISRANDSVYIETDNKSGNIYTIGVYSTKRISLFEYFIANLEKNISIKEYDPSVSLTNKEEQTSGVITKDNSIKDAILCSYEKAGYNVDSAYQYNGVIVSAIYPFDESKTLLIGDIITEIDNIKITSQKQMISLITNEETYLKEKVVKVKRSGFNDEISLKFKFFVPLNNKCTIYFVDDYDIDSSKLGSNIPKWTIKKQNSIGSSGGAMLCLSLYNFLTENDITSGRRIVGTGTIDIDGNIGAIGALPQKIATAVYYEADVLFVPYDNVYKLNNDNTEEKVQEDGKYIYDLLEESKLNYVVVKTFDEMISYLNGEYDE